ncbi:MAG: SPOR domain-containing protein [Pseudomonadota bacterium]
MVYCLTPFRLSAAALAACGALITAPLAADVKRGVDAWSEGDFDTAVVEWREPAAQGDADALFNLAQAYRLGRGVTADIERARELYAEAAEKGHVKAADNYGLLLFQQGQQSDAMPLIKAASDRGDPRAQYVLGLAHFNADYADRDWVRAYALLTLAQGKGLPQASGALQQMDQYVPLAQRQKAQALARDLEAEADKRRAAQMAAADLRQREPAQPVRVAATTQAPAPRAATTQTSTQPVRVPASAAASNASASTGKFGDWAVQLGAFGVAANADRLWNKLSGNPALSGTQKKLVPGGRVTRLRAVGYSTRAEASRACAQLSRQGQACVVAKS